MVTCFPFWTVGQGMNYAAYYKGVVAAEEAAVAGQWRIAKERYDSAFASVRSPLARDYAIAAQLAQYAGEYETAFAYLQQAVRYGYPVRCLKHLTKLSAELELRTSTRRATLDSLYAAWRGGLELDLAREFTTRFATEQSLKGQSDRDRYVDVVRANTNRIYELIDFAKFPSVHLVGYDGFAETAHPRFDQGCDLGNDKVLASLLHADSPLLDLGWFTWLQLVEEGQLHPTQLAYLYEFERSSVSFVGTRARAERRAKQLPDFVPMYSRFGPRSADTRRVELDRASLYLRPLRLQHQLDSLATETGIRVNY